jgi:hypothetical protein
MVAIASEHIPQEAKQGHTLSEAIQYRSLDRIAL